MYSVLPIFYFISIHHVLILPNKCIKIAHFARVAGGLLNKSNSFLNELAQDIFGQSIITHKPYEFDANNIRGTVLCLCNGNTKNIPTSEFGFFLQIQIPYEDVSDFFRLQFVFEAKMSGDVMGNMFWRVIWNDKPCLWTQMSIASLP